MSANYRKEILEHVLPFTINDPKIVLLVCDMGFGVVEVFHQKVPKQIYNVGIMEQATVGIAAGMAMVGLKPIVYSITNFLVYRAIEQMRNDVVLQKLPVKFIATGVNNYFKFLGESHCCGNDDVKLMNLIDMPVFDPYTQDESKFVFKDMVKEWLFSTQPGYIRV